jgi:hypothetical protein
MDLYLHSPIWLRDIVLDYFSTEAPSPVRLYFRIRLEHIEYRMLSFCILMRHVSEGSVMLGAQVQVLCKLLEFDLG